MADDQNPQLPLDGAPPPGGTNLIPINIEEEMRRSYLDYSMSVIIGRALPDARDGLKPVHRRVLYTMTERACSTTRSTPSAPKSWARPWESTILTATRPSTTRWCAWRSPGLLRYPLVDGQGNFGSVDGDPPAAIALHRVPHGAHRRRADGRHRHGNRRLRAQLRRVHRRALGSAHAHSQRSSSTARAASPSAWRPTFRRTI